MNIFVDYHHDDLLSSLHSLFEKRLKMKMYRPIGLDWYNEGFWKIAEPYDNNPATIAQYLVNGSTPEDGTRPLNTNPRFSTGGTHSLMTLKEFKETPIDIVIASYLPHVPVYKKLIKLYHPEAKLIHQMGNNWSKLVDYGDVKNVLASTAKFKVPQDVNVVFYHQEFNTNTFRYEPPDVDRRISSFVNVIKGYEKDYRFIKRLKSKMDNWNIRLYGASCPDGVVQGHKKIARTMHRSLFGLHLKAGGDGFGHIIHNWFASGRPPIVKMEHYKGTLAGELMEDGVTCVTIDGLSVKKAAKKIIKYSDPTRHTAMCMAAYNRFVELVDYDKEEKDVKNFLSVLN